jgi:hypothetical protein
MFTTPVSIPSPPLKILRRSIEIIAMSVEIKGKNIALIPNKIFLESKNIPEVSFIGLDIITIPIRAMRNPTIICFNRVSSNFLKEKDV